GLSTPGGLWEKEEPILLDPADLAERFHGSELTPELMAKVNALGLIELTDDGRLRIMSPRFLEIGTRLAALGFPVDEIVDEYVVLRETTEVIAERFTELFRRHVWHPFEKEGMPAARVPELTKSLEDLGPLAQAVVDSTLAQALQ